MELKYPYTLEDVYEAAKQKRFTVISTFSGGGGSSLGYKLAGGDVLVANEFVKTAADTYNLNFPDTPVIQDDIKKLTGKDFLDLAGLKVGELDVLDGSPPCSAFSTAGSREKGWNKEKKYSDNKKVTNIEDLFLEFIRVANDIQPKIIIAENVEGLQFSEAKKKLHEFLNEFEKIGYVIQYATIKAVDYGAPQRRARTIIIGIRQDIFDESDDFFPTGFFPEPLPFRRTLKDALESLEQTEEEINIARDINKVDSAVYNKMQEFPAENHGEILSPEKSYFQLYKTSWNHPCPTLTASVGGAANVHPLENRKFTIKEFYRIMALPDDYKNSGNLMQQYERVGRMHCPFPLAYIANHIVTKFLGK
jgi:DNA (cytosine-5)-methyltransferase 1